MSNQTPDSAVMEQHSLAGTSFGFSAVNMDGLGASEYTLVTIAVDASRSVSSYRAEIEGCLKQIIEACVKSPRADNLLVRVLTFNSALTEMHGFKPLADCHPAAYDNAITPRGMTALCDATINAVEAANVYGKALVDGDFDANGILIVISDGKENYSTGTVTDAKKAIAECAKNEHLESMTTILVGVVDNDPAISQYLADYKDQVGFTQYVEINKVTPETMAKLAQFVSSSIASQSQSLGTGGPSQPLNF